jgi:hypothetical protein
VLKRNNDRLIETERCYGMEMNEEQLMVMRIIKQPSQVQFMLVQKQLGNVEYFSYIDSPIARVARCTCEPKSMISMGKRAYKV